MIAMSDLGEALIIRGLVAREKINVLYEVYDIFTGDFIAVGL